MGKAETPSLAFLEIARNPNLEYFSYANSKQQDICTTNYDYSRILNQIQQKGSPEEKKKAREMSVLFKNRNSKSTEFYKTYTEYWSKRNQTKINEAISQDVVNGVLKLSQLAWSHIENNAINVLHQMSNQTKTITATTAEAIAETKAEIKTENTAENTTATVTATATTTSTKTSNLSAPD